LTSDVSRTVAKALRRLKGPYKAAHEDVGAYAQRYMANRGLVGGSNIAHFTTQENARTSIVAWEQQQRNAKVTR
jgi:hypothetical protein